jgi:hypothetical protein
MEKLFSRAIIVFLQFFVCITVFSQNPVTWTKLKSTVVQSNSLVKQGNSIGYATSIEVLFGKTASNNHEGYLTYQVSDLAGMRKIGFANVDSDEPVLNAIDYYFDLQKQGVLLMRLNNQTLNSTYAVGDILKLSREADKILFYKNDQLLLEGKVNTLENLVVRAELKSNTSSISGASVSFTTQRNQYASSIDYSTGTITLSPTIAQTNEFNWEDGEKGNVSRKFLLGHYPIEIKDQNGNSSFREYSVGNLVSWTQFNNTTVTNNILSKNTNYQNNAWVSAKSSELLHPSDNVWLEYIIESQVDQKVIGLTKLTTPITNFTQIEAGFLISKDNQLQVIHEGRIIKNLEYNEKDRLLIEQKDNSLVWKLNDKEVHYQDQGITSDYYLVGLLRLNATLKNVQYLKNGYDPISVSFDEVSERGLINVDISGIPNIVGPYSYIISENPIPTKIKQLEELRTDPQYTNFSESDFLQGNTNDLSKSYSDLTYGEYFVSVFNNLGERIFSRSILYNPQIEFLTQTSLTVNRGKIISNNTISEGVLDLVVFNDVDWSLKFDDINLKNEQFFGLVNHDNSIISVENIQFGFIFQKNSFQIIENGILQSNQNYSFNKESLSISKINDEIIFKKGKVEIRKIPAIALERYRFALQLKGIGKSLKVIFKGVKGPKKLKYSLKTYHGSCFSSFGKIVIHLDPTVFSFLYSFSNYNVTISGITADAGGTSIDYSFSNLLPGDYTGSITYTINNTISGTSVNQTIPLFIRIDSEMEWTNFQNTQYNTSNEVLYKSVNVFFPQFGTANSANEIETTFPYYVDFNMYNIFSNNTSPAVSRLKLARNSLSSAILPGGIEISTISGIYYLHKANLFNTSNPILASDRLRYQVDNLGGVKVFKLNSNGAPTMLLSFNYAVTPADLFFKAYIRNLNTGFINVTTNLKCKENKLYAKMERKLTGVKYTPILNKVYFFYEEEYKTQNIGEIVNLKVFNEMDRIDPVISNSNSIANYGDNRYSIDVSGLIPGAYILEIINDKKEKFYLRFIR